MIFKDSSKQGWIISIIAAFLLCSSVIAISRFKEKTASYIDASVQNNVQEVMKMVSGPYSKKLSRVIKELAILNTRISETGASRSIRMLDVKPYIETIKKSEEASSVAFLNKKCQYLTDEGGAGHLDTTFDVISLFGERKPLIRCLNWRHDQTGFIIAIPVDDFSIDGHTYSAIMVTFAPETINEMFKGGSFANTSLFYLTDDSGATIFSGASSPDGFDNRLANYLAKGILDKNQFDQIRSVFKNGGKGGITIERDGVETYLCYSSIENEQNLIMEVPADAVRSTLNAFSARITRTITLLALTMLTLILIAGGLYFTNSRNRAIALKEIENKKILTMNNEQLKEARLAAEEASKAKSMFLSNMSHDIRTPMNAIIGFTTLAIEHIDEKRRLDDYLKKIRRSSNHLLNLINDVLDMSRIESGKMIINEQSDDLLDILSGVRAITESEAAKKNHIFTMDTSGIKDAHIVCDRLHLNQVLINVISNSIKYTPDNGRISLTVTQNEGLYEDMAQYVFTVKDNGIGMTEDFIKTVYEPFSRERNSTISGIQGTGLGMAITKNLVDMMGGNIDIKSETGAGTEVKLTIDFLTEKEYKAQMAEENSDVDFTGKKLLLVEDNELNLEIATMILEEYGFNIDTARDGSLAVETVATAKAGDYDAILMDIQMPVMNGYEATKRIRQLGAPLSGIPIIAMTANAFDEDRRAALDAGMNEHVSKPIDIINLKTVLSHMLFTNVAQ